MKRYTLKLGICGCTQYFHGKFEGQSFILDLVANQKLFEPIEFTLKEILVPENVHGYVLRDRLCHFFLDVHEYPYDGFSLLSGTIETVLTMLDDQVRHHHAGLTHLAGKRWYDTLPSTSEIIQYIELCMHNGSYSEPRPYWFAYFPKYLDWMAQEHLYPELIRDVA